MFHSSRTTLKELKKRYLNILKKCLLANLMMFSMVVLSSPAISSEQRLELESGETKKYTTDTLFKNLEHKSSTGNSQGGAINNSGSITFTGRATFEKNSATAKGVNSYGGAISNNGSITFGGDAIFTGNTTSGKTSWNERTGGGAIYNIGSITFNGKALFTQNALIDGYYTYGGAISNDDTNATMIFNGEVIFDDNKISSTTGYSRGIFYNKGEVIFNDTVSFKNNKVDGKNAGFGAFVHENISKAEFQQYVIFENNYSTSSDLNVAAAGVEGRGFISFTTADFINNISFAPTAASTGSAMHTGGVDTRIVFSGLSRFINNSATGLKGLGGAVNIENGTVEFDEVQFINNKADAKGETGRADGGALAVFGNAIFHKPVVFKDNTAKTDGGYFSRGGAIFNQGTTTFKNGFYFEGNKEIEVKTAEDGTATKTERLNDIYMANGIINIEGSNADAEEYIGGGIRGSEGKGTINKSSVATFVFGEESDSSGYTGIFNQTAGKTVAKSETFLGGTNNILGGELETHGSEILYTAVVGQNKDETTGEVLSSGTLTHLALGSALVEIKGLSFKEEGTNLSMTFKSGTSERARYQINEDIMNATGNKLAFENSELALADNIKVSGTIEAKNSDIDVGTREISVDEIALKENAVLKMTVNSLDEHGKVNGVITGTDTSKIALQLGVETERGIYQLFDRDNEVKTVGNPLFNIQDLEDGSFEIGKKTSEELSSSLSVGKNEGKALSAMMMRSAPNKEFKVVQDEVLEALQSEDESKQENAKEALTALSGRSTSLYQSQATAGFTQLHNVVSQMLMNTAAPVFGHNGGEEPARASVYVKGLYDRVNSLTGDGFRMRSKGAVLGVQSALTEDLTIGVGYAGVDTTAKEPLRRTEVKTNTGFISAQYQPNNWWVSGVVTYSRSQYDEEKQVLSSTGKANYDVDSLGAQITTGYNIKKGKVIVTPEIGIRYLNAKQEGYTDTLGTTVQGTNSDFVTTMAGFKVGADLGWIRPLAGVMVGYDVITDDVASVNTLANGATYTINGKALDRLSTTVVAGFGMDIGENATLKLEYNGNYRKEYLDHSGIIRLETNF